MTHCNLNWVGRLAAFKIMILPLILYLFRVLPIIIATSYFKPLTILLNNFIWKSKQPRCAWVNFLKHRSAGGMGMIDIQDYQQAVILDQIKYRFRKQEKPICVDIETATPMWGCQEYFCTQMSLTLGSALHPDVCAVNQIKRLSGKALHICIV